MRVTLGTHRGFSPGIPYVLEIWPGGCESPIHNHGNAYAVIKVLHGAIKVTIYKKTWNSEDSQQELSSFTASKVMSRGSPPTGSKPTSSPMSPSRCIAQPFSATSMAAKKS